MSESNRFIYFFLLLNFTIAYLFIYLFFPTRILEALNYLLGYFPPIFKFLLFISN